MILFCKILSAILAVVVVAVLAVIFGWSEWQKVYYMRDAPYPYYYRVVLPWTCWQFRHTLLRGWYSNIPGIFHDTRTGEIYFYVWRDERYL